MNDHYPFDHYCDYVEGRLSTRARLEFEAHLDSGCETCLSEIARVQRLILALDASQWPLPSPAAREKVLKAFSQTLGRRRRRRTRLRYALASGLLLLALLFAVLPQWSTQPVFAATLVEMTGPVYVMLGEDGRAAPAIKGQSIPMDASINTGPGADATLALPGDVRAKLGEGTEVTLSELTRSRDHWRIVLYQSSGQSDSSVEPGTTAYTIKTPAGEVVAVGTRFTVRVEDRDSTIVHVDEGEVEVSAASETLRVPAGMSATFSTGQGPTFIPSQTSTPSPPPDADLQVNPSATPTLQETPTPTEITESALDNETQTLEATEAPEEEESPEPSDSEG